MLFIKLSAKLKFCEKEPTDAEKIEKTLSTMLLAQMILQQQYRERGFTVYFELIKTLLQAKGHNELLLWNSNPRPVGTKPLLEVHAKTQNKQQRMLLTLAILKTSKGRTSTRDGDSVSIMVLTRKRMFLSQTIRSLTSLALVTSVAATATRLRNVSPLSTLWNCT